MRRPDPGPAAPVSPHGAAHGPGQPLDTATRAFMETRFGHDFTHVRVHSGREAAESAGRMSARAYTVGGHIVFGDGEYAPASAAGRRLLAHELTHVVQRDAGRTPDGLVSRQPATDETLKKKAVAHHNKQQERVAEFLRNALTITPDPKNPLQGDNLYRNTAQMVDAKQIELCVLSPTHDFDKRRAGVHAFFDQRVKHPKIGGDYPADPTKTDAGMVFENPNTAGRMKSQPVLPVFVPMPKPGTTPPPPPPPTWSPGEVRIYTSDLDISEADLKNTLVHEGQHVADLHDLKLKDPAVQGWQRSFEVYKTEFRAFWIQPPLPPPRSGIGQPAIHRLPKEGEKPDNTQPVARPASCTDCSVKDVKTGMKNKRQEAIFQHLLANYPTNEFSCLYACNPDFRKAVNSFDRPESANLVNSPRLLELNLALRDLKPAMTPKEASQTGFGLAVYRLDALDWAFLGDRRLSKPFWDALKANAPESLYQAMDSSVKKGGPDNLALNKALGVNPNPPHRPVNTTPP